MEKCHKKIEIRLIALGKEAIMKHVDATPDAVQSIQQQYQGKGFGDDSTYDSGSSRSWAEIVFWEVSGIALSCRGCRIR